MIRKPNYSYYRITLPDGSYQHVFALSKADAIKQYKKQHRLTRMPSNTKVVHEPLDTTNLRKVQ